MARTVNVYNSQVAATDFGRSAMKIVAGHDKTIGYEGSVPSGYTVSDVSTGDPDEMKMDGRFYTFVSRGDVEEDPLESDRMLITTIYGITKSLSMRHLPDGAYKVKVGVSIPINKYAAKKEAYKSYFNGYTCNTAYKENCAGNIINHSYEITLVDTATYPQGKVAGIVETMANPGKYSDIMTLYVFDLGSRTLNWMKMERRPYGETSILMPTQWDTIPIGTIDLTNSINSRLAVLNVTLSESDIQRILEGGEIRHKESTEIKRIVNDFTDQFFKEVLDKLTSQRIEFGCPVILCSGGCELLRSKFEEKLDVAASLGVFANAEAIYADMQ